MPSLYSSTHFAYSDRSIRSLVNLEANASSARTLNLIEVWKKHEDDDEYYSKPFFQNRNLNRSIIIKHRLRQNERRAFSDGRSAVTKVILPLNINDLRTGARYFFIGQRGYKLVLEELFGDSGGTSKRDEAMLHLMDSIPSLDPFLMRERLRKDGLAPARCYFEVTDADTKRMFEFVRMEVAPLIGMCFGDVDVILDERTSKLANKILANAEDTELDPLRQSMGMSRADFAEGAFCWKGFIYYKWSMTELLPKVRPVLSEILAIRPVGAVSDDAKRFIGSSSERLTRAIFSSCETVRVTLKVYDDAYADLTRHGHPEAFREFLLKAPSLFYELGERLGAIQHIISFWRYRFPPGTRVRVDAEELVDLLADFELSISLDPDEAAA